jgi:hypothetical protein
MPDKDEVPGSSPDRPTIPALTSGDAGHLCVRSRGAPPGSSGDHADHPHVRGQFGRPRATSTPHNWHNFLRCHEQAAECRHPVATARFEAPPRRAGTPVLGPVSPKRGSSRDAAGPPTRNDRGARSGPLHVLRRVVAQDGQAHRVVTTVDVRMRLTSGVVCRSGHARQRPGARGQRPRTMSRSSLPRRF